MKRIAATDVAKAMSVKKERKKKSKTLKTACLANKIGR